MESEASDVEVENSQIHVSALDTSGQYRIMAVVEFHLSVSTSLKSPLPYLFGRVSRVNSMVRCD